MQVAVLNCDGGLDPAIPATLSPALAPYTEQLVAMPLATQLLQKGIWNSSSPASKTMQWKNFTCQGAGCLPLRIGLLKNTETKTPRERISRGALDKHQPNAAPLFHSALECRGLRRHSRVTGSLQA